MSIFDKFTERVGDFFDEVMLPEGVRRAHDEALRHMNADRCDRALVVLRPTLIEHPNVGRTHHLIGRCHFERGDYGEAIAAFERALAIRENAQTHFYAGLAAEKRERWSDVQRHFSRALGMGDDLPFAFELHFGLGRAYRQLGRSDKAIKELRKALKISPGQFDATLTLVEALLDRDQVDEADEVLRGLEASERPRQLVLRAIIDERRGEFSAALDAFDAAAHQRSDHKVRARLGAARNAVRLGQLDMARRHLAAVLPEHDEDLCEASVLRGQVAETAGELDRARTSFQNALELDQQRADALLGLGRVELAEGHIDAAAANFVKVFRESDPALRQEAWWGMGRCHLANGDLAGARHLLEEALELGGPRRADVLASLGETALELGDAAEAIVVLRDALELVDEEQREAVQARMDEALQRLAPVWELPDGVDDPERIREVLDALLEYLGKDARLSDFLAPAQKLHAAINSPLSLAIVGEFNAGKSTIVNTLVGEDVFPIGVLPTTAHTGILRWGPRKAARVVYDDGHRIEQSLADAKKTMKTDAEQIERLEFTHPHPDLRLVHYWDTPGFNALEERHEEVASEALDDAEAILWVMDAGQVLSQTEFDKLENISSGSERVVVVINKIDRLGPPGDRDDEVRHLLDYVEDNLSGRVAGCYAISALEASSDDEELREASGFEAFREHLEQRVIQRAGRIKTIEVGRQLEHLVFTLDAFQNGLVQRYRRLGEQVAEVEERLVHEETRLPARSAAAETQLMREWVERILPGIEAEIADSLRPTGGWTGKLALLDEDRAFILGLVEERFDRILDASYTRTSQNLAEIERDLAERIDPVVRSLALGDTRALQRRLDGFFDETRVLADLWEERIYGALRERTRGRIDTVGESVLSTVEAAQSDRTVWRNALSRLFPEIGDEFTERARAWYDAVFEAARRFCSRTRKDLELLELEAQHRYDVTPVLELVTRSDEPGEEQE
jgi:tetratricopeptide (TPR) repeat protein